MVNQETRKWQIILHSILYMDLLQILGLLIEYLIIDKILVYVVPTEGFLWWKINWRLTKKTIEHYSQI